MDDRDRGKKRSRTLRAAQGPLLVMNERSIADRRSPGVIFFSGEDRERPNSRKTGSLFGLWGRFLIEFAQTLTASRMRQRSEGAPEVDSAFPERSTAHYVT